MFTHILALAWQVTLIPGCGYLPSMSPTMEGHRRNKASREIFLDTVHAERMTWTKGDRGLLDRTPLRNHLASNQRIIAFYESRQQRKHFSVLSRIVGKRCADFVSSLYPSQPPSWRIAFHARCWSRRKSTCSRALVTVPFLTSIVPCWPSTLES